MKKITLKFDEEDLKEIKKIYSQSANYEDENDIANHISTLTYSIAHALIKAYEYQIQD